MLDFVDCCCVVDHGLTTPVEALWRAYKDWCLESEVPQARRKDFVGVLATNLRVWDSPQRVEGLYLKSEEDWDYLDGCSYVYLISDGTHVKIGKSSDPHRRLKILQTGNAKPLRLLEWAPGDLAEERILHDEFSSFRVRGEWFDLPESQHEQLRERLRHISLAYTQII